MDIVSRINAKNQYIVTPLNDDYDTVTFKSKLPTSGQGDLVIHRNMNNPDKYDIKVIIEPFINNENDIPAILQNYLTVLGNEISMHPTAYREVLNKDVSMFVKPYIYVLLGDQDLDNIYTFYQAVMGSLRIYKVRDGLVPISGILH